MICYRIRKIGTATFYGDIFHSIRGANAAMNHKAAAFQTYRYNRDEYEIVEYEMIEKGIVE